MNPLPPAPCALLLRPSRSRRALHPHEPRDISRGAVSFWAPKVIRHPYEQDPDRDPNLENYRYTMPLSILESSNDNAVRAAAEDPVVRAFVLLWLPCSQRLKPWVIVELAAEAPGRGTRKAQAALKPSKKSRLPNPKSQQVPP